MKRQDVLIPLLALHTAPRYLEVGVEAGVTFHAVTAARKIAVDPRFNFEVPEPRLTPDVAYHEITSDEYFGSVVQPDERFDVIFLDGLHTSEQTLRDLLNAVEHLAPGGVIVIDDTLPNNYVASIRSQHDTQWLRAGLPREQDDKGWMGDVFRTAFFVETFLQAFSFATVAETPGQLVLWRQKRAGVTHPGRTLEEIGRIDFLGLYKGLPDLRPLPFAEIVEAYRAGGNPRRDPA